MRPQLGMLISCEMSPKTRNEFMSDIVALRSLRSSAQLEPYINHIRFPHYKNLMPGSRIVFDFPFTALVGANGTNKSSVLKALFGAPGSNNLGTMWFSTSVDPIDDTGERPRFIYGYKNAVANDIVEVIKTRIHQVDNPDYWEPSRAILKDGMIPIPKIPKGVPVPVGRSKTRWNPIVKNVVYLDFRSEISAFDKYFYHGILAQTVTLKTKQDYIRQRAKRLKDVVVENISSLKIFKGKREYVFKNVVLDDEMTKVISSILGRTYSEIRLVEHGLFKSRGYSALLKQSALNYSEAWAGSGEFAVVRLVFEVFMAPEKSLILLDEPEVSLHPGAQRRLVDFLLSQIKEKKHQVVVSTHSSSIIGSLPPEAIKLMYLDEVTNKVKVTDKTHAQEAFFQLGAPPQDRLQIYVEDRLAEKLVDRAIVLHKPTLRKAVEIHHVPGGAATILTRYVATCSQLKIRNSFFLFDGDQKSGSDLPDQKKIPVAENKNISGIINKFFGVKIELGLDGGKAGVNETQKYAAEREFLDYCQQYISYLPMRTPEDFLVEKVTDLSGRRNAGEKAKNLLERITKETLQAESVTSEEIFVVQRQYLAKIEESNSELKIICDMIERQLQLIQPKAQ